MLMVLALLLPWHRIYHTYVRIKTTGEYSSKLYYTKSAIHEQININNMCGLSNLSMESSFFCCWLAPSLYKKFVIKSFRILIPIRGVGEVETSYSPKYQRSKAQSDKLLERKSMYGAVCSIYEGERVNLCSCIPYTLFYVFHAFKLSREGEALGVHELSQDCLGLN